MVNITYGLITSGSTWSDVEINSMGTVSVTTVTAWAGFWFSLFFFLLRLRLRRILRRRRRRRRLAAVRPAFLVSSRGCQSSSNPPREIRRISISK